MSSRIDEDDPIMLAVFDAAPDAMLIVDEQGAICRANSLAAQLFGYETGALLGQPVDLLVPPRLRDGHPRHRAAFAAHAEARSMAKGVDLRAMRRDGGEFVAQISLSPLEQGGRRFFMAAIRDVTQSRQVQSRFQGLLEAALDAIVIVDGAGSIVLINSVANQLFGYDPGELVGQPIQVLVPNRNRARHAGLRERYFSNPSARPMMSAIDIKALRKDGSEFPAEISLSPMAGEDGVLIISAIRDVTVRRRSEALLLESEQRLSTTLDSIGDAVIATDLDGNIVRMNPVAESLTEWRCIDARTKPLDRVVRLVDARNGEALPSPVERVLGGGRSVLTNVCVLVGRTGTEHYVTDNSAPIRGSIGEVQGVVIVLRDVTEQRHLEHQVEVNERMASLGRLASAVAHEINNPLTYVVANLDYVADEVQTIAPNSQATEDIREALVEAKQGADRVRRIVRDLRSYSRGDAEPTEPVDLRRVLEAAAKLADNEIHNSAQLVVDYDDVPAVDAHQSRLEQVFMNLLLNATHAFEGHRSSSNKISVRLRFDGIDRVVATVRDTGPGLPAAVVERLFQPFVSSGHVGAGTGLGLAICRSIVESYRGTIVAESTLGEGTVFTVSLPVAALSLESPRQVYRPSTPARRGRILIVDDEPLVAAAVRRVLTPSHHVEVETSCRAALDRLRDGHDFDVLVCDVMMPAMSVIRLHAELVELAPELAKRMIFLTGGAFGPEETAFVRGQANVCLEKPIDRAELLAAVDAAMAPPDPDRTP